MSYTRNMIHAVWRTKNNYPFLIAPYKGNIINHIKEYTSAKGLRIDAINGPKNHLHCLYELPPNMTLLKSMMYVKGESSHWINQQNYFNQKFRWADNDCPSYCNPSF